MGNARTEKRKRQRERARLKVPAKLKPEASEYERILAFAKTLNECSVDAPYANETPEEWEVRKAQLHAYAKRLNDADEAERQAAERVRHEMPLLRPRPGLTDIRVRKHADRGADSPHVIAPNPLSVAVAAFNVRKEQVKTQLSDLLGKAANMRKRERE